ncbi:MAG: sensor histidine kinase [Actinobacteria bacterium]|nr:sensor histidine kinase [Actinomycetota bacterium]
MSATRRRISLPLAAWVTGGVGVTVLVVLLAVTLMLVPDGVQPMECAALVVGAVVGAVATGAALLWSRRITHGLRALHADAIGRLRDPAPGRPVTGRARMDAAFASQELDDLARVLDALQLRALLADEVAEQARRGADNASAGMFELLSGLVAAEEATRGQLAAELHDTVAQSLMAARSLLAEPQLTEVQRARLRQHIEDAEEQVRAVMARTRPPELRDGDLAAAVSALRRDMASRYLLDVRVSWPAEPYPVPLVSAVATYRFFQEALLNVVKHADVDAADISLTVDGEAVVSTVRDGGAGFDPAAVRSVSGRHVGLGLLRERARLAGGSLEVDSRPGAGTCLTLRLPTRPGLVLPAAPGPGAVETNS